MAIAIGPPYAVAGDLSIIYLGYAIVWGGVACIIVSRGRSVTGTILSVQGIGAGISLLLTVLLRAQPADTAFVGVLAHTADTWQVPRGAVRVEGIAVTVDWSAQGWGLAPVSTTFSATCDPKNQGPTEPQPAP